MLFDGPTPRDERARAVTIRSDGMFHPARAEQLYDTVEVAAVKLSSEPIALRARLRRAQRREGNAIVADLGGGIHAFKFGRNWRIRFPDP